MESQLALTGKDYVLIVSDTNAAMSIIRMKNDEDKMRELSEHLVMAFNGESGDTLQFAEFVERNLRLYTLRHDIELQPKAAASWIRRQLADSLRSRHPYAVNLLLGGYDVPSDTPALFWLDYLGTLAHVPYACHGYASFFATSTFDRYHKPDMDLDAGIQLMKRATDEVEKRLIVNPGGWKARLVTRDATSMSDLGAADWTGIDLRINGANISDQFNRNCYLRGVNLSGGSKLPSNQTHDDADDFFDSANASFINRPFALPDAAYHLTKLRNAGHTILRLLVTWEALEHAGLGKYDYAYMEYLKKLCGVIDQHGMRIIIDAHQDIWSRVTGGSGAPAWTVTMAGYDLRHLDDAAAAYHYPLRHQKGSNWSAQPGDGLEEGVWPSGYQKSCAATLATLFWAGSVFAPGLTIDGRNIQHVFQEAYIGAYAELARYLSPSHAVLAFDLINEPHRGYIELDSFERWNYNTDLHIAHVPSPVQGMALGMGYPVSVAYYERSFPFPTRKTGERHITPRRKAFQDTRCCPWLNEGVWAWSSDKEKPVVLRQNYFQFNPVSRERVEWYRDFYWPFARSFADGISKAAYNGQLWNVVEPIPNEFFPHVPALLRPHNLIASPHWYDLNMLFKKVGTWWSVNVQGLARGMMIWNALYIGDAGLRKNYSVQIGRIVRETRRTLGALPIFFGETGIPMDINNGEGQYQGEWRHHRAALDALISALETHAVGYTLWNYNPDNTDEDGDVWNGENFSLFSKSARSAHSNSQSKSLTDGLRIPDVWIRPYACKVSGEVLCTEYLVSLRKYTLRMAARKGTTEIYVPSHYFASLAVEVSGGSYTYNKEKQSVYWTTEEEEEATLTLHNPDIKVEESWLSLYGPLLASLLFLVAAVVTSNLLTPIILALKEQNASWTGESYSSADIRCRQKSFLPVQCVSKRSAMHTAIAHLRKELSQPFDAVFVARMCGEEVHSIATAAAAFSLRHPLPDAVSVLEGYTALISTHRTASAGSKQARAATSIPTWSASYSALRELGSSRTTFIRAFERPKSIPTAWRAMARPMNTFMKLILSPL
ncbi:hypothetical protein E3P81_01096 [Wallemia ichthyophaga]|nr:hypothetical protein E3P97_01097 [Wallemia ichthyophaga]TIB48753.1 hypothetical protein E3P82_01095 [Wallemia ichthyophaga]TIB52747.1 hypothetical protein E3P81_01096 [Wallemia ichthyophaga]TIB55431.1 hypothetical protein E3P80_01096 [Wallemia ichthyophaga]